MNEEAKTGIAALIGRPLLESENKNFDLYYDLAKARLNGLLGSEVFGEWSDAETELKFLLSKMFDFGSKSGDAAVESKSVDGYSVKFRENSAVMADFVAANLALIRKYQKIDRAEMRSGKHIYECF